MMRKILFAGSLFLQLGLCAQSHDAELITHKTNVLVKENKLRKNVYSEIRINNRAGEKYAKYECLTGKKLSGYMNNYSKAFRNILCEGYSVDIIDSYLSHITNFACIIELF